VCEPHFQISPAGTGNRRFLRYAPLINISMKGPPNCRFLGCARDDKGEGDASMESRCWTACKAPSRFVVDVRVKTLTYPNPDLRTLKTL
jgi:hypothetical protein